MAAEPGSSIYVAQFQRPFCTANRYQNFWTFASETPESIRHLTSEKNFLEDGEKFYGWLAEGFVNGLLNFFGIVSLDSRCARLYVERMQDWLKA